MPLKQITQTNKMQFSVPSRMPLFWGEGLPLLRGYSQLIQSPVDGEEMIDVILTTVLHFVCLITIHNVKSDPYYGNNPLLPLDSRSDKNKTLNKYIS